MNTLTPKIIQKFKPVFSVPEYRDLIIKYRWGNANWMLNKPGSKEEYWNRLPEYVLSKCPICGIEHTDWLDLHSFIMGWGANADTPNEGHVRRSSIYRSCEHHVAMPTFIHLNGNIPDEYLGLESEVPYLSTFLFPESIKESYAVINAFPICRIDENQFIPTYTLFVLKYYAADPKTLKSLRHVPWGDESRPPFLYHVNDAWEHRDDKVFDLKYWVEQGRLFCIGEENGKVILRNNADEFPYAGIEGFVENIIFKNREMLVNGHDNSPRYYPTWEPSEWREQQIKNVRTRRYKTPLPGSKYLLIILVFLPIVAIVTSLFFWPIIDPLLAWILMLFGVGVTIYFTIQTSSQPYKEGRITRRAFMRRVALNLIRLLLTTGAAILAGGWTVQVVGQWTLKVTNLPWLGVVTGMFAAFIVGFGVGWLVRWVWIMIFKPSDESALSA